MDYRLCLEFFSRMYSKLPFAMLKSELYLIKTGKEGYRNRNNFSFRLKFNCLTQL